MTKQLLQSFLICLSVTLPTSSAFHHPFVCSPHLPWLRADAARSCALFHGQLGKSYRSLPFSAMQSFACWAYPRMGMGHPIHFYLLSGSCLDISSDGCPPPPVSLKQALLLLFVLLLQMLDIASATCIELLLLPPTLVTILSCCCPLICSTVRGKVFSLAYLLLSCYPLPTPLRYVFMCSPRYRTGVPAVREGHLFVP